MGEGLARRLADYAFAFDYEQLPEATVHQAKRLIIDSLGCAIGGFGSAPAKAARALAGSAVGRRSATVLGTADQSTPDLAAFANCTMVRYLDFNDAYAGRDNSHPTDNLGIVFAAAEAFGGSGRTLIAAFVLAYEIQAAFADSHKIRDAGPWDQASYASVSAPLAVGNLMGLNPDKLCHALNLSLIHGLHLGQARMGELSHLKASTVANAGRNGIFNAMLAEQGFTGPPEAIEGDYGFFAGLARQPITLVPLAGECGGPRDFRIMRSRIKRYPSGFYSQSAIEAALQCRDALGLASGEKIRQIQVRTFQNTIFAMAGDPMRWRPVTRETADHSLPFVVALAIQSGRVEPDQFVESIFCDPLMQALMDRIEVALDPECEAAWPDATLNIVTVETLEGRTHTARVPFHLGHFRRPMSDADLEDKFRGLCEGLVPARQQDAVLAAVWAFEQQEDLRGFMAKLVVQPDATIGAGAGRNICMTRRNGEK